MSKLLKNSLLVSANMDKQNYLAAAYNLNKPEVVHDVEKFITSSEDDISKEILEGVKNIIMASKTFYEINQYLTEIEFKTFPDVLYDEMLEKYKSITGEEPFQTNIPAGMRGVDQDFPELSGTLDKAYEVYNISEKYSVEQWLKKIMKETGREKLKILITPKFDGTSVTITYKNRKTRYTPKKALTRGDFKNNKGVDLSNILFGRDDITLPKNIDLTSFEKFIDKLPDTFGIQYEAMITEYGREMLSKIIKGTYKTRRAAIAAALKRISNPNTAKVDLEDINKCITLVPLMIDNETLNNMNDMPFEIMMITMSILFTYYDMTHALTFSYRSHDDNVEGLMDFIQKTVQEYSEIRNSLSYNIDGLVITIADKDVINEIGRSNNKNKWQIAYKFNALAQKTKINGMILTQGNQGYIGCNITFDKIEFNGIEYDKAPVNNITRFNRLNPRIGDEVVVSYNADVMGYIDKDDSCKSSKGEKLKLPERCINCDAPLIVHDDKLKCENVDNCPGHKVGRILETIRVLDLDYFGEETANDLVRNTDIGDTISFIKMQYNDLAKVLKGLNLEKAWFEFENKINRPIEFSKVIDLLRIPKLRTANAKKIVDDLGMAELLKLIKNGNKDILIKKLKTVKGINKIADDFAEKLIEKSDELDTLMNLLMVIADKNDLNEYDKIILISGFRSNEEFEKICKKKNFKYIESGSKYNLLVATDDRLDGKKAKAAEKKGIPVMSLVQFIAKYE